MLLFDEHLFYLILKYIVLCIGLPVFVALFFVKAGYGRYLTKKWGPQMHEKLGWLIMESIPPILFFVFYIISDRTSNLTMIIFLLIWELHYIQRAFVYPFLMRGKKKIPITIIMMGLIFNGLNAYLQARYLYKLANLNKYPSTWLINPAFIIGTSLFFIGYVINLKSDFTLRHLRSPGEPNGYKIPYGGLFRYISCPNYFGEILEWIGWAILTWSVTGVIFAVWTAANLIPRGRSHHSWYQMTFQDYPTNRKAIIPFIF
jgi:3-oxo-5-alpha-steroid 4-dehydrogenase 1